MKPQQQLIKHDPENGQYGDCQRTCVAVILDMDAADVPHFCDGPNSGDINHPDYWAHRQRDWLAKRGLSTSIVAYSGDDCTLSDVMTWTSLQSPDTPMILAGVSSIGCNHVVVVLNGEIVCDPSGNGIVGPTKEGVWEVSTISVGTRYHGADKLAEQRAELIAALEWIEGCTSDSFVQDKAAEAVAKATGERAA